MTIEISSGRGYIKPDSAFEKAIPFLNDWVVISARYMLSRVQMAYGKPLWSSGISFGTRAKIFRVVYLQTLIGRAIIASAIAKLYPPDDDETYAEFAKRVLMAVGRQELAPFVSLDEIWFLIRSVEAPEPMPAFKHYELLLSRGPFDVAGERALLHDKRIDAIV